MSEENVPTQDQLTLDAAAPAEAPAPKRRPGRPRKKPVETPEATSVEPEAPVAAADQPAPKRRPGRPRKQPLEAPAAEAPATEPAASAAAKTATDAASEAPAPKRRPGRPRKKPVEPEVASEPAASEASTTEPSAPETPAARLTRRREPATADVVAAVTQMTLAQGAQAGSPADAAGEDQRAPEADSGESAQSTGRRRRHKANDQQADQQRADAQSPQGVGSRNRRNRRNKAGQDKPTAPSLTREELEEMKVADLRAKAAELGIDALGRRKRELIDDIFEAAAAAEGFHTVRGVLQLQPEGYGVVRTGNFAPGDHDAFVHQQLIRQLGLRAGDMLQGMVGPGRANSKYPPMLRIDMVNGKDPEEARRRPRFRDLTPIYPNERLVMEHGKESTTGRAIDLVAPIGKGQRGLIVSPPKAGKTTILKKICQSIAANNPEVHLFCLLVDERPEEVTDMERSIRGDVVASTFDMPASNHTAVAEMVIEHAKRLVEMGEDVVVVLDSITRLARAYNLAAPASGRILSGGVDSAALYPPKKFLGAARNIENGGSLTILASALVDTGSKMDEVIFEEFKGTGNMELKLDRDLADRRIFPAIDPVASGTRNEDLLIETEMQPFVWGIRRVLANMNNIERAASALVKGLRSTNDNIEFLIRSAKKAAQTDYVS